MIHEVETVGFGVSPAVLTPEECVRLLHALGQHPIERSRAGIRHALAHPSIRDLANDTRLIEIASQALGGSAVPYRATLFEKSPLSNWLVVWHQDTALPMKSQFQAPGWGPWSVKAGVLYAHAPPEALRGVIALRVHLDASESTNGPLRVVPGSHRGGVLTDAELSVQVHSCRPVTCLVPQGGLLAMRPLLIHSSSKATSSLPRRVIHIEYAASLRLLPGQEIAAG